MKITSIKIFKAKNKGPVLAYANIVIDNYFIIRGLTLLETPKSGRYVAMPSRRLKGSLKDFRDICHPLNNEIRQIITEEVFKSYDEFIKSEE